MWTQIEQQISEVIKQQFKVGDRTSVSGGCINQGYKVTNGKHTFFVKLNRASQFSMFEAEALGLKELSATGTILVPKPICYGVASDSAYIVLEWLEFGRGKGESWQKMGQELAKLHQVRKSTAFGWERNNTIGATPQINTWTSDWTDFFTQHRIGYQLQLAKQRGGNFSQGDRLLAAIPELLMNHKPRPSLVHGDLWSGNAAFTRSGEPVIFDPATYWGDREVDIAMTELFGGFPSEFYQSYNQTWPLDAGYKQRKTLYNLYHVLNHFNLFGGSYESQANQMIRSLL
ncbi:fructosamine kinase family protein [Phormidesmis priestleyi]